MNYYSSEDMLVCVAEMTKKRMPKILGMLAKKAQGRIIVTGSVPTDGVLSERDVQILAPVRSLMRRFESGQYQHTDSDEDKLKGAMDWLTVKWAELQNQSPNLCEFNKQHLRRREPLPNGSWDRALATIAQL